MAYKIAVASSDGKHTDLSFGEAQEFYIYEVEGSTFRFLEKRRPENVQETGVSCGEHKGCGGSVGECSGKDDHFTKVEQILDCRCLVCKTLGFQIRKILEKRAIAAFDVECEIDAAIKKIAAYLDKVDHHQPFRGGV